MKKPFLFRFAQPCVSPGRVLVDPDYIYDETIDMVRWLGSPDRPLAIKTHGEKALGTKKGDIEKGEDVKDLRMWS